MALVLFLLLDTILGFRLLLQPQHHRVDPLPSIVASYHYSRRRHRYSNDNFLTQGLSLSSSSAITPVNEDATTTPKTSTMSTVTSAVQKDEEVQLTSLAALAAQDVGLTAAAVDIQFSHIQLYVDTVHPIDEYKILEASITKFQELFPMHDGNGFLDTSQGTQLWRSMISEEDEMRKEKEEDATKVEGGGGTVVLPLFTTHGRDVVKQLIAGFDFRITGCYPPPLSSDDDNNVSRCGTRSVLVASNDPNGIRILVTSLTDKAKEENNFGVKDERYRHFDVLNIRQFYNAHRHRQGIAVLAFEVGPGCLDKIIDRYINQHPNLISDEYKRGAINYENEARVFESFAYYTGDKHVSSADVGTRLRFVEPTTDNNTKSTIVSIPGMVDVPAQFSSSCHPAYFDHWVSNVISRTGFLDTLEDILSFTPKVDFNAGVVAAGEAQIESTVTGNKSSMTTNEMNVALRDQSQIYLPINNAVTDVGHVHGFLEEIGQGVQHVASRVSDIVTFVQRANDRRKIYGEGFTFLNIPRSYYGILTRDMLVKGVYQHNNKDSLDNEDMLLSLDCATAVYDLCVSKGFLHDDSSLRLDVTEDSITSILNSNIPPAHREEYINKRSDVVKNILHSRYVNLYNLLKDNLSEESYVAIVRNQILVDVQGEDLLFQIFTSNILQRNGGDEAPFFEFIQRVCSECTGPDGQPKKLRPGCGGFGIRNFLTLFLSIEVTKAMLEVSNAKAKSDDVGYKFAQRKVELFTEQLNESNPLLTEISDAMTKEGMARDKLLGEEASVQDKEKWQLVVEQESLAKACANEKLMQCNLKYQMLMKNLRESQSTNAKSN
jgi:4-hydroxyphenylpyruvate dioxygenase-like putative hemolysin